MTGTSGMKRTDVLKPRLLQPDRPLWDGSVEGSSPVPELNADEMGRAFCGCRVNNRQRYPPGSVGTEARDEG